MRVLLVSSYELGHQPLHIAGPAALLAQSNHEVRCIDLTVQNWDPALATWADALAFSVPMHTAMRLAMGAAELVREIHPDKPICFFGLYALTSKDKILGKLADRLIAGEYEDELLAWLDSPHAPPAASVSLTKHSVAPDRSLLPGLTKYAQFDSGESEVLAGYVEASHGCAHKCKHCPVPVIYDGRIRTVAADVVLEDIANQVALGAQHITFGDPDFLNGWRHSLKVVRLMHEQFPSLTFDLTTKVEHVLREPGIWPQLASSGCAFVVSAFECVNDEILRILDKGHTKDEAAQAIALLRESGIEVRPSWLPFMPWTTVRDVADILHFVVDHDLIGNVDPVQYSIRLLLPEGSLLLDVPEIEPFLGRYDPRKLTYGWTAADPDTVGLQTDLARLAEQGTGRQIGDVFFDIWEKVHSYLPGVHQPIEVGSVQGRPRLTEPWFC